jgi:hypothetical protein
VCVSLVITRSKGLCHFTGLVFALVKQLQQLEAPLKALQATWTARSHQESGKNHRTPMIVSYRTAMLNGELLLWGFDMG